MFRSNNNAPTQSIAGNGRPRALRVSFPFLSRKNLSLGETTMMGATVFEHEQTDSSQQPDPVATMQAMDETSSNLGPR